MRKESFLLRENEREWAKIVKKGLSSCVLTVKYNQKNNSIELDMINDKTKNILLVRDKDDFKQFSRRTLVSLNEEENCTTHQFMVDNISSIVRRKSNMNDNHVTLENQIIKALKLSIEEYKKKNSLRCDERQIEYLHDQLSIFKNRRQTRQYSKNNYEKNNGQIIYEMFGVYSVNDEEHPKKLKIKLSTFMSQTEYQCCLVIEETKDFQQLEKVRSQSKMLQNFSIQACQNLGYKLQKILAAEKVSDIISSQIYKSYNILYNLRDYICTMCNQLQVNIKKANQFPLQQLIQSVKKTFLDSDQENPDDPVKFSFINCIPDEFLNQNYLKLNQIICNTIEYFNKVSGNQSDDKWGSSQKFPTITLQSKISNPTISLLKSTAILSTIKKFSSCNMMYKQTNNQITQESENLDDQEYKDCENGQTDNFEKNPKQIEVIFQMLKGEKASCDVLKITIRNQLLLIPQKKLKRIYECIKYKLHNRSEPYSMLQWINNYYLIGQLGPYFDFFMSSSEISGTDFHFYIYQDLNLINNSQNDVIFKNSQFDSELNESKLHSFSVRTFNDQVDDTVAEKPKQLIKQESKELKCSDVLLQPIIQIQKSLIQNNNQNTNLIQSNDNNKVPQNNVVDLFLPLFEQTNSQYSNKPTSRKKSSCNLTKSDSRKRGVSFNSQQQYS